MEKRSPPETRPLLLLGVAGALRRSELVALDFEDVDFVEQGLIVRVRRLKTDQEGAGELVGVPKAISAEICPVRAMEHWFTKNVPVAGSPVFVSVRKGRKLTGSRLSGRSVATLVKRARRRVGAHRHLGRLSHLRAALRRRAPIRYARRVVDPIRDRGHR